MQNDPTLPDDPGTEPFWEERYRQGVTPWDLGEASLAFQDLMSSPDAPAPGKLVVLGCGRGHDAVFFARQGFEVTAVDFSPSAIEEARKTAERAGAKVNFIEHDLFTLGSSHTHAYNYVVEHTCFAAIPVVMHEEYVEVVK